MCIRDSSWSFEEVDEKLQGIMKNIFHAAYDASVEVGKPGDLMVGANVAGFLKVDVYKRQVLG